MARTKDRPSFPCRVEKNHLVATTSWGAEIIAQYEGKEVEVAVYRRKNPAEVGLYWHVLGQIVEATGIAPDAHTLSKMFLRELGYVERWRTMGGEEVIEPKSLADFDDAEFHPYLTRVLDYTAHELIPGLDRDALSEGKFVMREAA